MTLVSSAGAEDWPTYMHDRFRSGVTATQLELPLKPAWTFQPRRPPAPAWGDPAKQDFWHEHFELRAVETYDRAFHVVTAGETLLFGSSSEDKIYALDAGSGAVRWTFFTEGPLRFAPVLSAGRVYAGSDDGRVYCLSARDGSLIWKCRAAPEERMIPGNGRMISLWPVRTGLVVDDGTVYCTAGLFPEHGTYLVALDAGTGTLKYRQRIEVSPQGYLLASAERLYVPTGRTNPAVFSRAQGGLEGQIASGGGAYALLTEDVVVTGPGRGAKQLQAGDVQTKDTVATFGGLRMVVAGAVAYMLSERQLAAFDRGRYLELSRERTKVQRTHGALQKSLAKMPQDQPEAEQTRLRLADLAAQIGRLDGQMKACYLWTVDCAHPYSLIKAGKTLFVGGQDEVAAIDGDTGAVAWTGRVQGKAFGLCVAGGTLYVSTDTGRIHCFRNSAPAKPKLIAREIRADPYPRDKLSKRYEQAADYIVQQIPSTQGYCLVLDCGAGRLAYELARRTQLRIVGVESDAAQVERARRLLEEAGLCGRVTIHHLPDGELPYTNYFANVVVSDGTLRGGRFPDDRGKLVKLVRPCGGVLAVGVPADAGSESEMREWGQGVLSPWDVVTQDGLTWGSFRCGVLPGAGQWTHMYAEPGNSACTGDQVIKGPLAIQWFGEPGPHEMIDRHHRNMPPLCKDGRLFVPGDCVVYAVDAYNGAILWRLEAPNSRRLGAFLDCGNMAVDERVLYLAVEDECHAYNVQDGRRERTFTLPQLGGDEPHHWGYVAYQNSLLFGSGRKRDASYTQTSLAADHSLWYRNMKLVTSDYLFAKDQRDDSLLWKYQGGIILNTTLTAAAGRLWFVETSSPEALADQLGRMPVKTLFAGGDQHLVSLEQKTGRLVFKRKIDVRHFEEPVYLNFGQGVGVAVLLLSGSRLVDESVRYYYDAFEAQTGQELWHAEHDTGLPIDGQHGEYNRHPTIVGDTVYAWPYAYDIRSGKRRESWKFDRRGHGCGGISASAQCLFWRGGNPWMYDLGPQGGPLRLNSVTRPGCWLNMIPAGGLVLIPEASSGCTCGFSLQTSLAYIPQGCLD